MRKVIPYIASQFRKDKIWLRRTKPSKRQYQIFRATLPRGQSLQLLPSPWLDGKDVSIPLEHWDVLMEH